MKPVIIVNAFSVKMIDKAFRRVDETEIAPEDFARDDAVEYWYTHEYCIVHFMRVPAFYAADIVRRRGFVSAVGHQSTAEVISAKLGIEVPANRCDVELADNETSLLLCQVDLPRLAEGQVLTREQVEAAPIQFYLVELEMAPEVKFSWEEEA